MEKLQNNIANFHVCGSIEALSSVGRGTREMVTAQPEQKPGPMPNRTYDSFLASIPEYKGIPAPR